MVVVMEIDAHRFAFSSVARKLGEDVLRFWPQTFASLGVACRAFIEGVSLPPGKDNQNDVHRFTVKNGKDNVK